MYLPEQGCSVYFTWRMKNLITHEDLVKPTFNQCEKGYWMIKYYNELFYKLLTIYANRSCIYLVSSFFL